MKQFIYSLLVIGALYLFACAPAPHVRTGVKMNVPGAWQGEYPYTPPDSTVNMGRPDPNQIP